MTYWDALILGIVEGLTEYLPVSSTGHLILAQRALGIEDTDASKAYAICIQAGAILAVLGIFSGRVAQMVRGLLGRDAAGLRLVALILAAFVPTAVIALAGKKFIDKYLFGLWPVVIAWLVGGLAILAVSRLVRARQADADAGLPLERMALAAAFAVGVMQCLSLWPGTSRSLVTILGGLLVGLSLQAALEFSFLLGVVTLTAATGYEAVKHGPDMLREYTSNALVIGFVAATLAAALAVGGMLRYLRRVGLEVFGYYRIILAAVVAALIVAGRLTP
jgi:undecaprenyl-diphosphatase